jgi:adenylate cyclase
MRIAFRTFPGELEADFQRHYAKDSVGVTRIGIFLGIGNVLGFIYWDVIVDSAAVPVTATIRVSIAAFLFLIVYLLRYEEYLQSLVVAGLCVAGLGIILLIYNVEDGMMVGIAGVLLCLMFTFGIFRLLFWPSLVPALVILAGYNVAALFSPLPGSLVLANNFYLVSAVFAGSVIAYQLEKLHRTHFLQERELELQRRRTDELISNMLPQHVIARLKAGEKVVAEAHGEASVLFADIVGFTTLTKRLSPNHLVEVLNEVFSILDALTGKHGVEKIKTVGDGYMVAAGVSGNVAQNCAEAVAEFALDMIEQIGTYARNHEYPLAIRVGIATGHLISGVIGLRKLSFDLWGDTVNLASRMENSSEIGRILVTESTYWRLAHAYDFEPRGKVALKGLGEIDAYILLARKKKLADVTIAAMDH